jgi:hypothetical protein
LNRGPSWLKESALPTELSTTVKFYNAWWTCDKTETRIKVRTLWSLQIMSWNLHKMTFACAVRIFEFLNFCRFELSCKFHPYLERLVWIWCFIRTLTNGQRASVFVRKASEDRSSIGLYLLMMTMCVFCWDKFPFQMVENFIFNLCLCFLVSLVFCFPRNFSIYVPW